MRITGTQRIVEMTSKEKRRRNTIRPATSTAPFWEITQQKRIVITKVLCRLISNLVSAGAPARYVKWRLLACQHATTSLSDSFASTFWRLPKPTAASNATAAVASRHLFIRFYLQFFHLNLFYSYIRSSFFIYEIICSFLGILRRIFIVFKESEISAGVPACSAFCSMCFVRLVVASRNFFIRIYS